MGNPSDHQCENGRVKKSEQEQVRHYLHKTCNRKFLEVSRCSRAKQRQRNVQKGCCTCKVVFFFC